LSYARNAKLFEGNDLRQTKPLTNGKHSVSPTVCAMPKPEESREAPVNREHGRADLIEHQACETRACVPLPT